MDQLQNIDWSKITSFEQLDAEFAKFGGAVTGALAVGLLISALGCFFGYKLMKIFIAIGGFLIGCGLGYGVVDKLAKNSTVGLLGGLVFGVLLAFAAFKLYKIGVFIMGFSNGFTIPAVVIGALNGSKGTLTQEQLRTAALLGLVSGVIVGIFAVIFTKPMIITSTAIGEGFACGLYLAVMIHKSMVFLPAAAAFIILGFIIQIKTTGGFLEHSKSSSRPPSQGGTPVG